MYPLQQWFIDTFGVVTELSPQLGSIVFKLLLFNLYGIVHFGLIMLVLPALQAGSSLFWPANGVVIGGLLILDTHDLPGVSLTCILWQLLAYLVSDVRFVHGVINIAINLVGWVFVTVFTRWTLCKISNEARPKLHFDYKVPVGTFLVGALLGSILMGLLGATYFFVRFDNVHFGLAFVKWALDDFIGIIMVVPVIITFPVFGIRSLKLLHHNLFLGFLFSAIFLAETLFSLVYASNSLVYRLSNFVKILTLLYADNILPDFMSYSLVFVMALAHFVYFSWVAPESIGGSSSRIEELYWNRGFITLVQICNIGLLLVFHRLRRVYESIEHTVETRTLQLTRAVEDGNRNLKTAELANKNREQFMSFLCHELRNPLNAINNYVDFLLDSPLNAEQLQFAQTMKQSGTYMKTFMNEVLDMTKFEANKVVLEIVSVDVEEIVTTMALYADTQCKTKRVAFSHFKENRLPKCVRTDPMRLQGLLYNLLSNAIKFTPSEGLITLKVKYSDGNLFFSVKDSGIGISREQQARLFEPFVQASNDTARLYGGSGLGLAITKGIVEAFKGQLTVQSELGRGSEFLVKIPAAYVEPPTGDSSANVSLVEMTAGGEGGIIGNTANILIVDDSAINRAIIARCLSKMNGNPISVLELASGEAVMQLLREGQDEVLHRIRLVFMDLHLGDMSGVECTRSLKARLPLVKVVCISGDDIDLRSPEFSDFTSHCKKPFTSQDVIATARGLLQHRG